jgi:Ca2+-binding RTX toxin-like protein
VRTASVSVEGSALLVTAAPGAKDNIEIARMSASVLRVTDLPSGGYTGSGVHGGTGCVRSGDYTAFCTAPEIKLVKVSAGGENDRVVNANPVRSRLDGGAADDVLAGGRGNDTLIGRTGADVMRGRNGIDQLYARDLSPDTMLDCDGGTSSGAADTVDLDLLPLDPDSTVTNCETETRH